MFRVQETSLSIPAVPISRELTCQSNAWGPIGYTTVRLIQALPALRVHTRSGAGGATSKHLAWGAGTRCCWFAIGDAILTRGEYSAAHALPSGFSHQDEWLLPVGTVINVGIAGPLFSHPGGAPQAEWLRGGNAIRTPLQGFWSNRAGTA